MPVNVPMVTPVRRSSERLTTTVPVAPANRPVPPVMVCVSARARFGNSRPNTSPMVLAKIRSPLAAVQTTVPSPCPVVSSIVMSAAYPNWPTCVPFPVPDKTMQVALYSFGRLKVPLERQI